MFLLQLDLSFLMASSRSSVPETVEFPVEPVYRIARTNGMLVGSRIRERDSRTQAGHRFDLVDSGVIYCATQLQGSFAEVLSPFRKTPSTRIHIDQNVDSGLMNLGGIPADWRERRSIFLIDCVEPLPFLDIENPKTLSFFDHELVKELFEIGINFPLDISLIRGSNRRLTRAISVWAANQMDEDGESLYSGIRYKSRLGDWECWAIFEETEVKIVRIQEIKRANPDLLAVADLYQLTIH